MMIIIAYVIGFCCIVITCIGMWMWAIEDKRLVAIICYLLAGIAVVTSLEYTSYDTEKKLRREYNAIIVQKDTEIENIKNKPIEEFYYADAEITEQKKQSDGTYKVQLLANPDMNVKDYALYEVVSNKEYDIMIPYMLTMNSNGTENKDDDVIVAVWACMN